MTELFAHIPKINVGLACLVVACFFLPWISFSCGTVTFLSLSGFHLATGKVSLDATAIKQYEQRGGNVNTDGRIPSELRRSSPRYPYFLVPFCAVVLAGCGLRMMSGSMSKFTVFASIGAGAVGTIFLLGTGIGEFGLEVPPGTAIVIQSSLEPGYFLTTVAMFVAAALPAFLLPALERSRLAAGIASKPAETAPPPEFIGGRPEEVSPEMAQFFGVESGRKKAEPELQSAPAPGTKSCPSCGVAVGAYQAKCVKCGAALKPDRR